MHLELHKLYEKAKGELETLCEQEKKLSLKRGRLETVLSYFEEQIRQKDAIARVDRPPLDDVEVTPPAKRNKTAFMIRICSTYDNKKFSQQDVINKLKTEYPTFDCTSVPYYLRELVERKLIQYDGLQYQNAILKKGKWKNYGFNVSQEVRNIVSNDLGDDSLAFDVSRVFQILCTKHPGTLVDKKQVGALLCKLEDARVLTSEPGSHPKAAKIYSIVGK